MSRLPPAAVPPLALASLLVLPLPVVAADGPASWDPSPTLGSNASTDSRVPGGPGSAARGSTIARPASADTARAGARLFPGDPLFPVFLADPKSADPRGSFVIADRPELEPEQDFSGSNIEAEVVLGGTVPVARFQEEAPGRPAVGFLFRVGVFSRFFMESPQKDLIAAEYRVDLPFTLAYRGWEARFGYQHFSSHFADDFVNRFDPPLEQISRDGFELAAARRFPHGVRVYAAGRANFHANPGVQRQAARWGIEWDPGKRSGRRRPLVPEHGERPGGRGAHVAAWPFAALDFEVTEASDGVRTTGAAGLLLRAHGQRLRLEARASAGHSALERLSHTREELFGLGLRVEF